MSKLLRRLKRALFQPSRSSEDYLLCAVVYWPDPTSTVPELRGPFYSRTEGLADRDYVRSVQRREEKMAHLMPFGGPGH